MRIATWNVNSVAARLPRLLDWLGRAAPDVVCLQETKCDDAAFPREEVGELGYEVAAHGDGRWNGVALLSRVGLDDVVRGLVDEPGFPGREARAVGATCGGLRLWSVYVPNGREPGHPHYAYKLSWLGALRDTLAADLARHPAVAVLGDFNVAPTDDDVWDPAVFAAATHVTPPERAALAGLRDLGLRDVVPRPLKHDRPFTYWDYRAGMFHKNLGMRIDLVYASPALAEAVDDAYVDREARKGKGPSDHAPVVVDLDPGRAGLPGVADAAAGTPRRMSNEAHDDRHPDDRHSDQRHSDQRQPDDRQAPNVGSTGGLPGANADDRAARLSDQEMADTVSAGEVAPPAEGDERGRPQG